MNDISFIKNEEKEVVRMSEAKQTKLITENGYDKWILNTFYFFILILNERNIIHLRHDIIFF